VASPDTDYVVGMFLPWLENIAKNTADALKLLNPGGGGSGTPLSADPAGSRYERAMEALGKRFESALSRWSRTPVEKLINTSLDAAAKQLDRAATTIMSQGRGLVNRGMQGTVEQARFDYSMDQLGRQMAGIFAPLTNAMTYFASRTTALLAGLNGEGQNRVLGMGVGAVAGYRMGGAPGALLGGYLGGTLAGSGGTTWDGLGGAAVGAAAGYRLGGPLWGSGRSRGRIHRGTRRRWAIPSAAGRAGRKNQSWMVSFRRGRNDIRRCSRCNGGLQPGDGALLLGRSHAGLSRRGRYHARKCWH
jgi:hypothetical protein